MNVHLTRFAPTPSGFLHLGNLYSFVLTKAIADRLGAKILLRIDDLDSDRVRDEYIQDIFDTLDFMELSYDQGPKTLAEQKQDWSQEGRLALYEKTLVSLQEKQLLFACNCSRKKIRAHQPEGHYLGQCLQRNIPLTRSNCALRFNTEEVDWVRVQDLTGKSKTENLPLQSIFSILKMRNGVPAYQLSSVVDDVTFGVDLIIRGIDLYPSTLTQLAIADSAESLGAFKNTVFHHHSLLKDASGAKLSKSSDSTSIQHLRKAGKTSKEIFSYLAKSLGFEPLDNLQDFSAELLKRQPLQN